MDMIVESDGSAGIVSSSFSGELDTAILQGEVYGLNNVGGVLGYANGKISNIYNNVNVYGEEYQVGGMIGYGSELTIENSYYQGIFTKSEYGWGQGQFIGYGHNINIINSFVISDSNFETLSDGGNNSYSGFYANFEDNYATHLSKEEIIEEFNKLVDYNKWSTGKGLPVIKWKPSVRIVEVNSTDTTITFDVKLSDIEKNRRNSLH